MVLAASRSATISACAVGSQSMMVRFPARPTTRPSATITAPTGTSPRAAAACASSSAARISLMSVSPASSIARQNNTATSSLILSPANPQGSRSNWLFAPNHAREEVQCDAGDDDRDADHHFVRAADGFSAVAHQRRDDQRERWQSDQNRTGGSSRHSVRPREIRFPDSQRSQRPEFQQNAQPGQQHVEDQAFLESERVAQRPEQRAYHHRYPRRARFRMPP